MLTFIFLVIFVFISFCLQCGYPNWDHLTKLTNHTEVYNGWQSVILLNFTVYFDILSHWLFDLNIVIWFVTDIFSFSGHGWCILAVKALKNRTVMSYTSQICGSLQISSVISLWTSLAVSVDIFGSLWTSSAVFGHLRQPSDIFDSFRKSSAAFGYLPHSSEVLK